MFRVSCLVSRVYTSCIWTYRDHTRGSIYFPSPWAIWNTLRRSSLSPFSFFIIKSICRMKRRCADISPTRETFFHRIFKITIYRNSHLSLHRALYLLKNLTLYFDKNKLLIKRTTTFWTCIYDIVQVRLQAGRRKNERERERKKRKVIKKK